MNTRAFLFSLVSSVVGGSGLAKSIPSVTPCEDMFKQLGAQTSGIVSFDHCAEVDLPMGFDFLSGEHFQRHLSKMGLGPPPLPMRGLMRHRQSDWWANIGYKDTGHVLDDEKGQLDADTILTMLRERERKLQPLYKEFNFAQAKTLGFELPPRYDEHAHLLEWAVRSITEGETEERVRHEALLLGRRGVVEVQLDCAPGELHPRLPAFRTLLEHFRFVKGEAYSDYEPADRLAFYGLIEAITNPGKDHRLRKKGN